MLVLGSRPVGCLQMMVKYWKRWQLRLEQIEEMRIQPQLTTAANHHRLGITIKNLK